MAAPVFSTGDVPTATQVNTWFVNTIFKMKASNESIASSITLQNDDDLFFSMSANSKYHVTLFLLISAQTANDFRMDFTLPASGTFNYFVNSQAVAAAAYTDDQIFPVVAGTPTAVGGLGGNNVMAHIEGLAETAGTSGTFQLQWAQQVSGVSGTTLLAKSFLVARQVS